MLTSSSTQRHGSEAKPISCPLTHRGADWRGGTDLTNLNSQCVNRDSRHHWWRNQHLLSTSGCWRLRVVFHVPPPVTDAHSIFTWCEDSEASWGVVTQHLWGSEIAGSPLAKGPEKTNAALHKCGSRTLAHCGCFAGRHRAHPIH